MKSPAAPLRSILLLTLILSAGSAAETAAQPDTTRVDVTLEVEMAPGPNCFGWVFARWPNVDNGVSYVLHGWDPWFWGTPFVEAWNRNDDRFYAGQGQYITAGGGMHQMMLSGGGGGTDCGATAAALEGWITDRFQLGSAEWYVEVITGDVEPPTAEFTWTVDENDPLKVLFDGSSSNDPDGQIAAYWWDFGDGATSTSWKPAHTFAEAGTYTVTLQVWDNQNQSDETTQEVEVDEVRWRYLVSLERVSGAEDVGKHSLPTDPEFQVGDTIRVSIGVENAGSRVIEDVQVEGGFDGISFTDGVDMEPVDGGVLPSITIGIEEETRNGKLDFDFGLTSFQNQGGWSDDGRYQFNAYVPKVTGYSVDPETGERTLEELNVLTCTAGEKRANDDFPSKGCAVGYGKRPTLRLTLSTDAAEGSPVPVKSGLIYKPGYQIAPWEMIDPNGSAASDNFVCRSACVEVEIEVLSGIDGSPVAYEPVILGAPLTSHDQIKTPPGTARYFCERTDSIFSNPICGNQIELTTDDEGRIRAYYTLPGVDEDLSITVTAVMQSAYGVISEQAEITVESNPLVDRQRVQLSNLDALILSASNTTVIVTTVLGTTGELCKYSIKFLLQSTVTLGGRIRSPGLMAVTSTAVEYICNTLAPGTPVSTVAGIVKRFAEILQWVWFFTEFDTGVPQGVGIVPRPPPQFVDIQSEYFESINEAIFAATLTSAFSLGAGTEAEAGLYEVSHFDSPSSVTPFNETMYFSFDFDLSNGTEIPYDKLLSYEADQYLLPSQDQFFNDILEASASRNDAMIEVRNEDGAGKSASGAIGFSPGDYVVISADLESEEFNQVISVDGNVLSLARPLANDHDVEAVILNLGPGEVAAPPPPAIAVEQRLSDAVTEDQELDWMPGLLSFATAFDLQISPDESFETLEVNLSGLSEPAFDASTVLDPGTWFWRVRSSNLIGVGDWSPTGVFTIDQEVASEPHPDANPGFELTTNYPNPFSDRTTIAFETPEPGHVRLRIHDVLGRDVSTLVDGMLPAGEHNVVFDASGLPSGSYVYRLEGPSGSLSRILTLAR